MKYLITGGVFGLIIIAAVIVFVIYSGIGTARRDRDAAIERARKAEANLGTAQGSLIKIAGGLTGNPQAEAATALDDIQANINDNRGITR
jgi:hypothetical protein